MLSFCQVCLRTDRKLREIAEALCDLHDELCDFGIAGETKFCYECEYMLKKFHDFKMRCQLAAKIVKVWKKEKAAVRKPLELVASKVQLSSLSLSNSKNFKVYCYQASKLHSSAPIETPVSSNLKHIMTINIPKEDQTNTLVLKPFDYRIIENDLIDEAEIKTENENDEGDNLDTIASNEINVDELIDTENVDVCQSDVKAYACDAYIHDDNINIWENDDKNCINNVKDHTSDIKNSGSDDKDSESDVKDFEDDLNDDASSANDHFKPQFDLNVSSDDEIHKPKKPTRRKRERKPVTRKKKLTLGELANINIHSDSEGEEKTTRKKEPPSAEAIRSRLAAKFENCGILTDETGGVIDKEFILNNLDVMTKYALKQLRKRVAYPKTITKEGIKLLSQLQKRYRNEFPNLFNVEHLTNKEQVAAEFAKRQYNERYVISQFKCELCYSGFKFSKLLDYHVQTAHNEHRPFCCSVCKMRFTTERRLASHTLNHRTVFKCKLCPLITNHKSVIVDHSRSHTGKKYTCDKCGATFKCRSGHALHRITAHPTNHVCNACGRNFANESGLQLHRSRKHPFDNGEGNLIRNVEIKKCEICDATFTSDYAMKQHLVSIHGRARHTDIHGVGGYKTRTRRLLRLPNYVCSVCNKTEHSYGALFWHFKKEHPDAQMYQDQVNHLCHLCGKGFRSITQYNDHEHIHTGVRPYVCGQCNKTFHRKINLKFHMERHMPKRRECKHCGKRFRSAANLSSHIKGHIGAKLHVCGICSKSFLHASSLNAHVRGVHQHIRRTRKQREPTD